MNQYVKEFLNRVSPELQCVPPNVDDIYIKLWVEHFLTKIEVLKMFKQHKIDTDSSIKREVCSATFHEYGVNVSNNHAQLVSFMLNEPSIQEFNCDPIDFVKFAMEMDYTVFEKRSPTGKVSDYLITTMYSEDALPMCVLTLNRAMGLKMDIKDFKEIDHLE